MIEESKPMPAADFGDMNSRKLVIFTNFETVRIIIPNKSITMAE